MTEVVIVEAVRAPIGRRNGGLSTLHPADLLGAVQTACVERAGIDPAAIDQTAGKWGASREEAGELGLRSQQLANAAWANGAFEAEVTPITAPVLNDDEKRTPTGETYVVARDEGLRETSLESLAQLKPVAREDGVHTAGTSSQVSDGAAAVLMMTAERAAQLGLRARARVTHHTLVGVDPVLILTGPIDATARLLERSGMTMADIDTVEINEAFASVVLAWARE